MPALALTDRCNLFGLIKFYQACIALGVKPIVGVDLWYQPANSAGEAGDACRVGLLALDGVGIAAGGD